MMGLVLTTTERHDPIIITTPGGEEIKIRVKLREGYQQTFCVNLEAPEEYKISRPKKTNEKEWIRD
jgi:hypothetical protein